MAKKSRLQKKRNYKQKSRTRVKKTRVKRAGKKRGSRKLYGGAGTNFTREDFFSEKYHPLLDFIKESCFDLVKEILEENKSTFVTDFYKYLQDNYEKKLIRHNTKSVDHGDGKRDGRVTFKKGNINDILLLTLGDPISEANPPWKVTEYFNPYKKSITINNYNSKGETIIVSSWFIYEPTIDKKISTTNWKTELNTEAKEIIYEAIAFPIIQEIYRIMFKFGKQLLSETIDQEPINDDEDPAIRDDYPGPWNYYNRLINKRLQKLYKKQDRPEVPLSERGFLGSFERDIPKTYLEYYEKAIRAGLSRKEFFQYDTPSENTKLLLSLSTIQDFLKKKLQDFSLKRNDTGEDRNEVIDLEITIQEDKATKKKDLGEFLENKDEPIEIYLKWRTEPSYSCKDKPTIWECLESYITETIDDEIKQNKTNKI